MPKQTGAGLGTEDSHDHTSKQEAGEERTPTGRVYLQEPHWKS